VHLKETGSEDADWAELAWDMGFCNQRNEISGFMTGYILARLSTASFQIKPHCGTCPLQK
jgi:hypothetical protein